MAELTGKLAKDMTKELGADMVGIASVDRFEGAPPWHGPLELLPTAKSVIVAAIRIPDPVVDCEDYGEKIVDIPPKKKKLCPLCKKFMWVAKLDEDLNVDYIYCVNCDYKLP